MNLILRGVTPMEAFGETLAGPLRGALPAERALVVNLNGDLGSGKTTLVRGIVRGLGGVEPVRSPTYSLFEVYPLAGLEVVHLDLYRLGHPDELEMLGLRELERGGVLWLVEWATPMAARLPAADLVIEIGLCEGGRSVDCIGHSGAGLQIIEGLS